MRLIGFSLENTEVKEKKGILVSHQQLFDLVFWILNSDMS